MSLWREGGEDGTVADSPMNHPNFFIIGAAKSGTTSLWMYLKQHPDIFMPETVDVKEPSFFCNLYGMRDFEQYLHLFDGARGAAAVGEASHAYLTSPESAGWIKKVYPGAKIIVILRNPADRAYSLYCWMASEGYEWIRSFEKALAAETERLNDPDFMHHNPQGFYYNYLYFHSGLYADQIERYMSIFPRDQILILLFEDLKNSDRSVVQAVYEFLGVDPGFSPEIRVHNERKYPLSISCQYLIKQHLSAVLTKLHIPASANAGLQKRLLSLNCYLGRNRYAPLDAGTRRGLLERYRSDITRTSKLIGRRLEAWR